MKHFLFITVIICLFAFNSKAAETHFSGVIVADKTFDQDSSPLIIDGDITVNAGVKLTIKPGVIVKFMKNTYIYVNGTLDASGSVSEPITFSSAENNPEPGDWFFIGGYDSGSSVILKYCDIKYVYDIAIYGTADIIDSHIENTAGSGISLNDNSSNVNINNCFINKINDSNKEFFNGVYIGYNTGTVNIKQTAISGYNAGIYIINASVAIENIAVQNCNFAGIINMEAMLSITGNNFIFSNNLHNVFMLNVNKPLVNNLNLPALTIPYFINTSLSIEESGILTINKGNIIKMADGAYIYVKGKLTATGTLSDSIYFTSYHNDNLGGDSDNDVQVPSYSSWNGIFFLESSGANSKMDYCVVNFANYGITVTNSNPAISKSHFINCSYGMYLTGNAAPKFTDTKISRSQNTPILIEFSTQASFTNVSIYDNKYNAVGLITNTLAYNAILKKIDLANYKNVSYLLVNPNYVPLIIPQGISLTIEKGIVIKSLTPANFIVQGVFNANGTLDENIVFTSLKDDNYGNPGDLNNDGTISVPAKNDVGAFIFEPGSTGVINYTTIKYAANTGYSFKNANHDEYAINAAIVTLDINPVKQPQPVISNCTITDCYFGIVCYRDSKPTIQDNSMINITKTPFSISGSSDPLFIGNVFTNVGYNALGIPGGYITSNGTIKKRTVAGYSNITYILLDALHIDNFINLTVEPGIVIKFNNKNTDEGCILSGIYVNGGFKAEGTANSRIIFTSINDDNYGNPKDSNGDGNATAPTEGDWTGIAFNESSDDLFCSLKYLDFRYSGKNNWCGNSGWDCNYGMPIHNLEITNANPTIDNVLIYKVNAVGIWINGNAAPKISNTAIEYCSMDPIGMSMLSNPTFNNITFNLNGSNAIRIIDIVLSSDATLSKRSIAGITNIAYICGGLYIDASAKLTINPGVVIKYKGSIDSPDAHWCWGGSCCDHNTINVHGALVIAGTANEPVIFTSFKDDSAGGDTNNDGTKSVPEKGDMPGIIFYPESKDNINSIQYSVFRYGGASFENSDYLNGNIEIRDAYVKIDNCTFEFTKGCGLRIVGTANPLIQNSNFQNIDWCPVVMSLFSAPDFGSNNVCQNIGIMALGLIPETYNQNNTVIQRNFAGYTNITYFLNGTYNINSNVTIDIPAGSIFKCMPSTPVFNIDGGINLNGIQGNPVIFTNYNDDSYGNPADTKGDGNSSSPDPCLYSDYSPCSHNLFSFSPVSLASSKITYSIIKYFGYAILLNNASPTINNTIFEKNGYALHLTGNSKPVVDNNSFKDLGMTPILTTILTYPASTKNNIITGTTKKAIEIQNETLTQDYTLNKRDFGGITNIPYLFNQYIIGTSVKLTISAGVVCKFRSYWANWSAFIEGKMIVQNTLTAIGGLEPENNVVFTSMYDDFYGGDMNSDSTATMPDLNNSDKSWYGIIFENTSLDNNCKLQNAIIRHSINGITTNSASPVITNCYIENNGTGILANASSNPVLKNNSFKNNYYYAVNNVDKSFNIDASNSWWGSPLGPKHSSNPAGDGDAVSDEVKYTPFINKNSYNQQALAGDISLNGIIQAYDASLALQSTVGSYTLSNLQKLVGDVSYSGGTRAVTAFDASLILQYTVGLINYFPSESMQKKYIYPDPGSSAVSIGSYTLMQNQTEFSLPLSLINSNNLYSQQLTLSYNNSLFEAVDVIANTNQLLSFNISDNEGLIFISFAGTEALNIATDIAFIKFRLKDNIKNLPPSSFVKVIYFLANETDKTQSSIDGTVFFAGEPTIINSQAANLNDPVNIYPQPCNGSLNIELNIDKDSKVSVYIYKITGQEVYRLEKGQTGKWTNGKYSFKWDGKDNSGKTLPDATYILRINYGDKYRSQIFQLIR